MDIAAPIGRFRFANWSITAPVRYCGMIGIQPGNNVKIFSRGVNVLKCAFSANNDTATTTHSPIVTQRAGVIASPVRRKKSGANIFRKICKKPGFLGFSQNYEQNARAEVCVPVGPREHFDRPLCSKHFEQKNARAGVRWHYGVRMAQNIAPGPPARLGWRRFAA